MPRLREPGVGEGGSSFQSCQTPAWEGSGIPETAPLHGGALGSVDCEAAPPRVARGVRCPSARCPVHTQGWARISAQRCQTSPVAGSRPQVHWPSRGRAQTGPTRLLLAVLEPGGNSRPNPLPGCPGPGVPLPHMCLDEGQPCLVGVSPSSAGCKGVGGSSRSAVLGLSGPRPSGCRPHPRRPAGPVAAPVSEGSGCVCP